MWVQPLGLEDPLEKERATYSSILAGKILWREETGGAIHRVTKSWTRLNVQALIIQVKHSQAYE